MGGVSDRGEDVIYTGSPNYPEHQTYTPPPPAPAKPKPPAAVPPPATTPAPTGPDSYSQAQLAAALAYLRGNTPRPNVNPQNNVMLSGPNPVVTDPFRHMFN